MHVELVQTAGEEVGRRWAVAPGQRVIVGRGQDVQVRLRDPDASRHHAALAVGQDGRVQVVDLGSTNGTFLGDVRLTSNQPRAAAAGDRVRVGTHVLELRRVETAGAPPVERRAGLATTVPLSQQYQALRRLGQGGAGTVHLARHLATGRHVAIKTLLPELARDDAIRERFLREGRIRVRHPNVVEVYDAVLDAGLLHLIMEYVPGGSAQELVARQGALTLIQAVHIGLQAARGLAAVHGAGIIHRDVKPANILLSTDFTAKVGDFGIAKQLGQGHSLTATGTGMGTLAYVSPEQARNAKRIEPTADLYSLGATIYHLVSGRAPFLGTTLDVVVEIVNDPPPPLASLRPDCPPALHELVHALLAKDPDERPPEADMVVAELGKVAAGLVGR